VKVRQVGLWTAAAMLLLACITAWSQDKRKIIIDEDAAGPGGTDQQTILMLIQSPQTEVLGVTVVTGDQWLKAEVAHTLRMLELIGRTDIPVVPGAEYPLVRRKQETELWEERYGAIAWLGAWTPKYYHPTNGSDARKALKRLMRKSISVTPAEEAHLLRTPVVVRLPRQRRAPAPVRHSPEFLRRTDVRSK